METLDLDLLRTLAAIASHDSFAAAAVQMGRTQSAITQQMQRLDRKSTRLNSSHLVISYAVFCLKKKNPSISNTGPWDAHAGPSLLQCRTGPKHGSVSADRSPCCRNIGSASRNERS